MILDDIGIWNYNTNIINWFTIKLNFNLDFNFNIWKWKCINLHVKFQYSSTIFEEEMTNFSALLSSNDHYKCHHKKKKKEEILRSIILVSEWLTGTSQPIYIS